MKFICMGYYNESNWKALPDSERNALMDDCIAYDDQLRAGGHVLGGEALQSADAAKTVRWNKGAVSVKDGPFSEAKEVLGGFLLLEARDIDHAVELISKHPGLKTGPFEVRGIEDVSEVIRQSAERRAKSARD